MKKLVAANWKMHPSTYEEARALARAAESAQASSVELVLFAPFVYLQKLAEEFPHLLWGAQDAFYEKEGPYTGEISMSMLRDIGVSYILVGHSERRAFFHETDESVSRKARAALERGFRIIVAIGEKKHGADRDELIASLLASTADIAEADTARLSIAYEPIWSISTNTTGETATPQEVEKTASLLSSALPVPYLYGGSVTGENVASFLAVPGVSGVLVGNASLHPEEFVRIIAAASSS